MAFKSAGEGENAVNNNQTRIKGEDITAIAVKAIALSLFEFCEVDLMLVFVEAFITVFAFGVCCRNQLNLFITR